MQTHQQPRLRKTPFGDTPAPSESRYIRANVARSEELARPAYEIFRLQPAIDGLGTAHSTEKPARN